MAGGRVWDTLTLGRRRRRRRMLRRLAELDRLDRLDRPEPTRPRPRRVRLGERARSVVAVLGVLALLVVAWRVNAPAGSYPSALGGGAGIEPKPAGPVAAGLERPEQVVTDDGAYRFNLVHSDDGSPVTYSSCQPVRLVVNPQGAPPGSDGLVEEAAAEIQDASGLTVAVEAATDERPHDGRSPVVAERPGEWAPSLVAWSDPSESPRLAGTVTGYAGSAYSRRGQQVAYVSGSVTLDGPQLTGVLADGDRDGARAIVVHELAHLVGLGHVGDPDELMYPQARPQVTELQDGDLAGLAALGAGECTGW